MAGGHGQGGAANQLHSPIDFDIDDDGSLFIADMLNHRIVRWKPNAKQGEVIAGGLGPGYQTGQLTSPYAVLIDRMNDCLIISDVGNRRVMRLAHFRDKQRSAGTEEEILSDIDSLGLAMDDEASLYVSDYNKHEVRRYGRKDGNYGVIVAGGNGRGAAHNQLNCPRQIFVDTDQSVYVSDMHNHRVMKWVKGATEGVVVAGRQGPGNSLSQLNNPSAIFVDRMGSVYVVDQGSDRVMRWTQGTLEGEVLVGGKGRGSQNNQLHGASGVSFDNQGNLYVIDPYNHRIQRFDRQSGFLSKFSGLFS